jgi:hypothetical protein
LTQKYEYEVAFSFNALDEGLATQLNDLISDRMKTFLYSERQREIAGRDGQEVQRGIRKDGASRRCNVSS